MIDYDESDAFITGIPSKKKAEPKEEEPETEEYVDEVE